MSRTGFPWHREKGNLDLYFSRQGKHREMTKNKYKCVFIEEIYLKHGQFRSKRIYQGCGKYFGYCSKFCLQRVLVACAPDG